MNKPNAIMYDDTGTLRSGWRAGIFLFAFIIVAVAMGTATQIVFAAVGMDAARGSLLFLFVNGLLSLIPALLRSSTVQGRLAHEERAAV